MSSPDRAEVMHVIARAYEQITGETAHDISPSDEIGTLSLDSLDRIELVEMISMSYSIEISDDQIPSLRMVSDLIDLVVELT